MSRIPHNIEARRFAGHAYRVGYGADGYAVRIYGDARHGYNVAGYYCRTLAEVSARLEAVRRPA